MNNIFHSFIKEGITKSPSWEHYKAQNLGVTKRKKSLLEVVSERQSSWDVEVLLELPHKSFLGLPRDYLAMSKKKDLASRTMKETKNRQGVQGGAFSLRDQNH